MNFLRQRLPAPRQDQQARRARQQGGPAAASESYQPSRIAQLAQESPTWYKSAARRKLYFLLFPAAVVSYATSGYDGSMMNSLQTVSYFDDFFDNPRGAVLGLMSAISNTCWYVGSIAAAWITFGTRNIPSTWSWRIPSLLQMAPSVVQLAAIWFVPESPRWLISHDRGDEAMEALKQYHGEGEETELVRLEFEEIRAAIDNEKRLGSTTWASMVKTKGNRYRMFLVVCMGFFSQWSGNGLIAYYLSRIMDTVGITNKNTQALVNGLLNIWNFGLALTTAFFVERIGRRPLFRISTCGMLVVFIGWTIASARFAETSASSAGIAVMALIFIYQVFYCIAFSPLPVAYSVEVLPYSIRAKGMATYVFSTKAAVFVNQYVNPIGIQNIGWRFYIVYVAILAVEACVAYGWFLETKGKALEEIAVIFDGEEANVRIAENGKGDGPIDVVETEHATSKV
ncbi:lactose permease [Colletotrichum lupini]|uniref:Lactose permease n=1 Tax=Colletotrichum lupini TaxID=145971 RepID=A0A9Q8T0U5_9PEZI|nr:lactose permease [Colletotrichum lupini]UQC87169.1 lactose permease [Colletotrichum lupini]